MTAFHQRHLAGRIEGEKLVSAGKERTHSTVLYGSTTAVAICGRAYTEHFFLQSTNRRSRADTRDQGPASRHTLCAYLSAFHQGCGRCVSKTECWSCEHFSTSAMCSKTDCWVHFWRKAKYSTTECWWCAHFWRRRDDDDRQHDNHLLPTQLQHQHEEKEDGHAKQGESTRTQ